MSDKEQYQAYAIGFTFISVIASLFGFMAYENAIKEIGLKQYKLIDNAYVKYPKLQSMVDTCMEDGKLSNSEYHSLKNKIKSIREQAARNELMKNDPRKSLQKKAKKNAVSLEEILDE